ncbi:desiccation-related protein clone PCC27-04 [Solanum pennellii]|uniref:Desiccation-related protein clone PCC27-04 n=1 Tax=Solanum pennellii TaxID=28526 RepID=A0ABM1G2U3_SOLPN|nr:desiccation-related protein clone PCC27-04 [Solanum pennellii]
MAHNGTSQGQLHLIDEHGNRVHQIDDPNAIQGIAMGFAPAGTSSDTMKKEHHEGQQLRHSCSSNSSSSEDDGERGRRKKKKGIKKKIKETLTGGAEEGVQTTIPISISTPTSSGEVEKKGIMEKIKEKIPGMH